jgi:hypothetical protein
MPDIHETLKERGTRYGNYLEQTKISASLQDVMHKARDFSEMDEDQQDALEMIAVKISRILNGDPWYTDNWRDIAGYATLVADRLEKEL